MKKQPNILLILNDDMGYSDIGCYGGEVDTPNLDRLARNGLRFSQFYNTARCSPSRASLLTGLHPHQTGIGILTYDSLGTNTGAGSFYDPNTLTRRNENAEQEARQPGFFYTDAISDEAVKFLRQHQAQHRDQPFFEYVAYTAPHWPLHAHPEDIAKYKGRFDAGWDRLREQRLERLVGSGILDAQWKLTGRDPTQPAWTDAEHKQWLANCMEVYAAQIDRIDQGIGRILAALAEMGHL